MIRRLVYSSMIGLSLIAAGCANRGSGPQGGPKDTIPPTLIKETPLNGTCNFYDKTIVLQFDEYVQLDNVAENVLISPPQQTPPIVKAIGKRVMVTFEETLEDSTTYTVDFGRAICDNNEKIPLGNYSFSFATGDHIDTLAIFGKVINAENLNPVQGVMVGVHSNLNDSVFAAEAFKRIAKTDSAGQFGILNLRGGTYRIYALRDMSKDYRYQPSEALAFTDETFSPTLATDSAGELYHVPDTILLKLFTEKKQRHYFVRGLRDKEQHYFTLLFSAPQDSLPKIVALRPDSLHPDSAWVDFTQYMLCQTNLTNDTLVYWLTDSAAIRMDTLAFLMSYMMSDSLYNLVPATDTVTVVYRHPRLSAKAIEAINRKNENRKVEIKSNSSNKFDIYRNIEWYTSTPLTTVKRDSMHLMEKKDSLLIPMAFTLERKDSTGMRYVIHAAIQPEHTYVFTIDSGAIHDIYNITNNAFKAEYHLRPKEEYASVTIHLAHFSPQARIQILDEKDKVIREEPAREAGTKFSYLEAKSFYVRLYIDIDGNGEWTTGDWATKRQPEPVYYFPKKLSLRANWDFEETFDYLALPLLEQKPQAIRKTEGGKKK